MDVIDNTTNHRAVCPNSDDRCFSPSSVETEEAAISMTHAVSIQRKLFLLSGDQGPGNRHPSQQPDHDRLQDPDAGSGGHGAGEEGESRGAGLAGACGESFGIQLQCQHILISWLEQGRRIFS